MDSTTCTPVTPGGPRRSVRGGARALSASLRSATGGRATRAAHAIRERRRLEHDLASYTSAADLVELTAIMARHTEDETADIRRILAGRQAS